MEVKTTYWRQLHSMFEGFAFMLLFLSKASSLFTWVILNYVMPAVVSPAYYQRVFLSLPVIEMGIFFLIAYRTRIRPLSHECLLVGLTMFSSVSLKYFFYASSGLSVSRILLITYVKVLILIVGCLYFFVTKQWVQPDDAVAHTYGYKAYRLIRGAAFIALLLYPIHIVMHYTPYLPNINVVAFIGVVVMIVGYYNSIVAFGIELLLAGCALILFVVYHLIDVRFSCLFSFMGPIIYIGLGILFFHILGAYLKKHKVQLH